MDPTPDPVPVIREEVLLEFGDDLVSFTVAGAIMLGIALILIVILVWAIHRAGQYNPPSMLVIVLGVLAVVSALGYMVGGEERAELVTLAATAVGALAGALTVMVQQMDTFYTGKNGRNGKARRPEEESDGKEEVDSARSQETRPTPSRLGSPAGQADSQEEVGRSSEEEGEGGTTSEAGEDSQEDAEEERVK